MKYNILKWISASVLLISDGTQAVLISKHKHNIEDEGQYEYGGRVILKTDLPKIDVRKDETQESKDFDKLFDD